MMPRSQQQRRRRSRRGDAAAHLSRASNNTKVLYPPPSAVLLSSESSSSLSLRLSLGEEEEVRCACFLFSVQRRGFICFPHPKKNGPNERRNQRRKGREREREDTEAHEKQRTESRALFSLRVSERRREDPQRIFFSFFTLYSYTFFPNSETHSCSLFLLSLFLPERRRRTSGERSTSVVPSRARAIFAFVDFFFEKE